MKIIFKGLFYITCIFLLSFKNSPRATNIANLAHFYVNQEEEEEEFVELMDGKIIKGNVTKCNVFSTSGFRKKGSGHVIIDDVRYEFEDVMAVQYKKSRFRKNDRGEFTKRTEKGRISLYYTSTPVGGQGKSYESYFVLKGDTGALLALSVDNLRLLVNDYPPAIAVLDKFESQTEKEKRRRKMPPTYECLDVYNKQ